MFGDDVIRLHLPGPVRADDAGPSAPASTASSTLGVSVIPGTLVSFCMRKRIYFYCAVLALVGLVPPVSSGQALRQKPEPASLRGFQKAVLMQSGAVYRPIEVLGEALVEGEWMSQTRTRNVFHGIELAYRFVDTWDEYASVWVETTQHQYAYYDGLMLQDIEYEADGAGGWVPLTRISYTIENHAYAGYVRDRYDGTWIPEERVRLTNVGHLTIGGVSEVWTGLDFSAYERYSVVESDGSVIETYESGFGDGWTFTERYIYPNITIADLYAFVQDAIQNTTDLEDLLLGMRVPDHTELGYDGFDWYYVGRQTTTTSTTPQGLPVTEAVLDEEWQGLAWVPVTRQVTDYAQSGDLANLPVRTAIQYFDEGDWFDLFVESYVLRGDIRRIAQATIWADFGGGLSAFWRHSYSWAGLASGVDDPATPSGFRLDQNYPNPFNPQTSISFSLDTARRVRLAVYDQLGREVAVLVDGMVPAGSQTVAFEGSDLPSGVYLYRLQVGEHGESRLMTLLK